MTTESTHEISDGALLALLVNDHEAIEVLAAWGAARCKTAEALSNNAIHEVMTMLGWRREDVHRCMRKLVAARVLRDGGITELADKFLQTHVQRQLNRNKGAR